MQLTVVLRKEVADQTEAQTKFDALYELVKDVEGINIAASVAGEVTPTPE